MKTIQQQRILQLLDCINRGNTLQNELSNDFTDPISIRRCDYIQISGQSLLNMARLMGLRIEADLSDDPDTDQQQYEFYCRINGITFYSYLYTAEETQIVVDILEYVNTKYNKYFSLNEDGRFQPTKGMRNVVGNLSHSGGIVAVLESNSPFDALPTHRYRSFAEYVYEVVAENNLTAHMTGSFFDYNGIAYLLWEDASGYYISEYREGGVR